MALRVDQHDLDVTAISGKGFRQIIEQAPAVLRGDMEDRRALGEFVVDIDRRLDPAALLGAEKRLAGPRKLGRAGAAIGDTLEGLLHLPRLIHARLKALVRVGRDKAIQRPPPAIGKGLGLFDIEPAGGNRATERGEKMSPVRAHHDHFPQAALQGPDANGRTFAVAPLAQLKMSIHLFGRLRAQVTPREPFQKLGQFPAFLVTAGVSEAAIHLSGFDANLPGLPGQFVIGRHIELPQQFLAPGRHGRRMHGADVGQRDQRQRLEAPGRSCPFGQFLARARLTQIPRAHEVRHRKVMPDQEPHGVAPSRLHPDALHRLIGHHQAVRGMIAAGNALPRVVEEQCEIDVFRIADFRQQPAESLGKLVLVVFESVQHANGPEHVLIDGVAVIEVANDETIDFLILGKQRQQRTGLAHRRQRPVGMPALESLRENRPNPLSGLRLLLDQRQRLGNAFFRRHRQAQIVARQEQEEIPNQCGPRFQRVRSAEKHTAPGDRKITVRESRAAVANLREQGPPRRRRLVNHSGSQTREHAHVAEVLPHPVFGAAHIAKGGARVRLGDAVLSVEAELVAVAAVEEMQVAAKGKEKALGPKPGITRAFGEIVLAGGRVQIVGVAQLGDPAGQLEITQAAGTALDIRFEMVNRAGVARVPRLCQLDQVSQQRSLFPGEESRQSLIAQLPIQLLVPGHETLVQQADA